MKKETLLFLAVILLLLSCHHNVYRTTNRAYKKKVKEYARILKQYPLVDSVNNSPFFAGTTNFSIRKPNFVVIHHTAQNTCDQTLKTFTIPRTQVSAHYVVCRDGTVFHMLNDYFRAHHAGVSKWGNNTDLNSSSIGIEIDNNGSEPFTEPQMNSVLQLLDRLKKSFAIPQSNFIGHADVAPGRKVDPSRLFSWKLLSDSGYGYWYDTLNIQVPDNFNAVQGLRIIGYNIKDSLIAIQSYKIHFTPQDSTRILSEGDRKIIYDLSRKYQ